MPEEEAHYLKEEFTRLIDKRFWLILEIIVLGIIFYQRLHYENEKLNMKQIATKIFTVGILTFYVFGTIKSVWQVLELYYNRQEVNTYEIVDVNYKDGLFYSSDGYFSDLDLHHYYKLKKALPDTLDIDKKYIIPIKFSVGRFGWRFDPEVVAEQIREVTQEPPGL